MIVALLLGGGAARGDGGDVDAYKAAVEQGTTLFNAGDFSGARAEFEKAYAIHAEPVLLFNIASCYRRAGDAEAALTAYQRFVDEAAPDDGRLALARETMEQLRSQLQPKEVKEPVLVVEEPPLPPARPAVAARAPVHRRGSMARRVGVALLAGSAAALGLAVWQAGRASDAETSLERLPEGTAWDGDQAALYDQGRSAGHRALLLGAGGAALAVTGAVLVWR
ncbi:MAG TPA: tetratricopeptide repeat protein, partial [Kofleriaceae bacterium]|nr:tetratricopeptide repeat protein [Kofleriaceae bacterium]